MDVCRHPGVQQYIGQLLDQTKVCGDEWVQAVGLQGIGSSPNLQG